METDVQTTGGLKDYAPKGSLDRVVRRLRVLRRRRRDQRAARSRNGGRRSTSCASIDRSDQPVTEDAEASVIVDRSSTTTGSQRRRRAGLAIVNKFDTKSQTDALVSVLERSRLATADQQAQRTRRTAASAQTAATARLPHRRRDGSGGDPPVPDAPVAPDAGMPVRRRPAAMGSERAAIGIGLMGLGVVGSGVARILQREGRRLRAADRLPARAAARARARYREGARRSRSIRRCSRPTPRDLLDDPADRADHRGDGRRGAGVRVPARGAERRTSSSSPATRK